MSSLNRISFHKGRFSSICHKQLSLKMIFQVTGVQSDSMEKTPLHIFPLRCVWFAIDLGSKTIECQCGRFVGFAQLETLEQANTTV